jgi:VCBS repeat-containing protein
MARIPSVTSGLGSVVVNLDNTLTYTPATSYNSLAAGETASVEVTYAISDGNGGTSSSVATITVTGTNDGPTATVDIATTDEDAAVTFGVLSNDTDPDTSDTLSVTSASVTSGLGSVVVNLDNTLTYTPATSYNSLAAGETASVEVTYAISDGNGGTSSSVATITVTGTNDGPTATVDIATTDEDAAVTFGVLSNDTDPDTSDTLSVTSASVTSGLGSVVVNLDNTLTYTPATSYNSLAAGETASVEVTYAISDGNGGTSSSVATITVTGTNDGPTATVDIATTDEDAAVTFGVLSNDTDPDTSDTLSVTSASVTSGLGSVVVNLDNTLTYTPATSYNSLAAGETASVEVTYAISDGNGGTSSSVATITVTGTNDGPTATVDIATTDEDAAVTFGVLSNDTDPDTSDTLSVTSASVTSGLGSVVVNLDNTLTYTPATSYNSLAAGETASVEVTYAISDGNGGTSSSVATITVTGTNDGPTATVDIATTDEDAAVTFGVLSNDTDPDTSDTLSVTSASVTSGLGSVVVNLDNTLTYTPATSYNSLAAGETASVEVTYAISDGNGGTSSSVATITVTGTNDGPTATVDIATTDEDAAVTFGVLSNDTDPDTSDTLSVTSASVTSGLGSVVVNLDNTLTYTPATSYNSLAAGETASVEVTYAISDGNGGTSSSVATITVTGTNDGPTATVDIATTDEDAAVTFGVLSNDTDPDTSDTLSVTSASVTSGLGSVVVNLDNTLTYTPATSYNSLAAGETASVEVTYAISDGNGGTSSSVATITVTGTNDGPTATVDIATTDEDAAVTFGVLSNDTDPDTSDTLSVTSASVTSGLGSVVVNLDNTLTYTPATSYNSLAAGETASVEVTYAISDGNGGTSSSVATITVTGTNDGPTATVDIATTDEDAAVTFGVLSNDTDPDTSDTLSVTSASVTSGLGSVVVNLDNTLTYTPATSYNSLAAGETASVEVTYAISDGNGGTSSSVATITVTGTNDGPTATVDIATTDEDAAVTFGVLSNDTDPDTSDTLSVTSASVTSGLGSVVVNLDNTLTYTPATSYNSLAAGETASVEVTYAISDGNGGTSSSVATITVTGTNDGPTATVDIATTDEDAAVTFGVLSNDTDPDTSDTLSVTSASVTSGLGSVVVNLDNTLTYTPATSYNSLAAGETASVEVTYAISDGNGGTSSSVATITVTGTNDGPTATVDIATTDEDAAVTFGVLSNDTDPDTSDTLSVTSASVTSGLGSVVVNLDNTLTYTPATSYNSLAAGETASVEVTYAISDGNGGTSSSVATITVTGTNDGPTATVDIATTDEDAAVTFGVLSNDTDPDTSDTLSVTSASVTSGLGSVVVNLDNTLTYTPATSYNSLAAGETASVEVTYAISDGNGGTSSSVATITVTGTNDGPTATVDIATTDEDAAVTFGVLSNDTDPDTSDTLSVTSASVTSGLGSVVVNLDNTLTYTPAISYNSLAAGETASVEVTYAISDGNGGTSSSVATITVTGTNDGPTATVDIATTDEDAAVTFGVLSNDTDPDTSDTLSVTSASVTSGLGSVVVNLDNTLTYTPATSYNSLAAGETASVEVTYAISDGNGGTSSSVATITVTGTNDGPVAVADSEAGTEDSTITGSVASNDSDVDDAASLTYVLAAPVAGLTLNTDGSDHHNKPFA